MTVALKRIDVASEIRLNARQREALETAETNQQQARQQQIRASIHGLSGSLQGKSAQELQTAMADRAKKMEEQMRSFGAQ